MTETSPATRPTLLDRFYTIGVIVKGIDGAIEFLVGALLLLAPTLAHTALSALSAEAGESQNAVRQFVSSYVESLDDDLAKSGMTFLIVFLLLHGVVKLVLVYCLLRKFHRVYPIALIVLLAFLVYQVYTIVIHPTVGSILLAFLDAIIIVLVYREYRELKAQWLAGSANAPSPQSTSS